MGTIKEIVQNLVAYLLLITVILNLVKSSSYKKYIELFTGLTFILLLFTPTVRLLSGGKTLEDYLEKNQFLLEMQDSAEFIYEAEENTEERLLELYSEKIEERIVLMGEKQQLTVEQVKTSISPAKEGFGAVEKIEVWTSEGENKQEFRKILAETFELSENKVTVN